MIQINFIDCFYICSFTATPNKVMKKIFYLSSCSTCKRIMSEIPNLADFELQDIKKEAITAQQLEALAAAAGSYEALFSRKSQQYRPKGYHQKQMTESDYKDAILEEYTFLKRPVVVVEDRLFIGNSKETVEQLLQYLV
jgi:arsenate reductase (glutaredoxin)